MSKYNRRTRAYFRFGSGINTPAIHRQRSVFSSYQMRYILNELEPSGQGWKWVVAALDINGVDAGLTGISSPNFVQTTKYMVSGTSATLVPTPADETQFNAISQIPAFLNSLGLSGFTFGMHEGVQTNSVGLYIEYPIGTEFYMVFEEFDEYRGYSTKVELICAGGVFSWRYDGNDLSAYVNTYAV